MHKAISTNRQSKQQHKRQIAKFLMIFVGISGCFSVLFGAWLAHGGQALALNVQLSLKTALQYQLLHTLALLASLVWVINKSPSKILIAACIGFFIGILCFSGSIYIKTFFSFAIIGKLTPLGGISLAIAWLLLSIEGIKNL
ncbi:hypothetical protein A9Q74_05810 [Colwellia sp. 39_35_sub15_T18]|nr:hypothetical protein A9Q74_05810 [Colwellia sp. 39_35_sub15_T18]